MKEKNPVQIQIGLHLTAPESAGRSFAHSGYCLCGVLYDFLQSMWGFAGFSSILRSTKNIALGWLDTDLHLCTFLTTTNFYTVASA